MTSLILRTTSRFLVAVLLLYSVFLLFRGHNHPGGGFVGGLVAASAWALYGIAFGPRALRQGIRREPLAIAGCGLAISAGMGLTSLLGGQSFLTGNWVVLQLSPLRSLTLGTPLLFDLGVYFVVLGTALAIILSLEEES